MYIYSDYDCPDPPHQPLYLRAMLDVISKHPAVSSIIDVGCGDGNFTKSLADAGYRLFGIDLSEGGICKCQQRYPEIQFRLLSVYDDYRTAFDGVSQFDAIVSVEVIEHLYSPRQFARRCAEAVRPGGLVVVTTPYWGYAKNIALAVTNRMDRALTVLWDGGHIKHFSYKTLRLVFEDENLEFLSFHGCGRKLPGFWKGMMMVFRKPGSTPPV
jgi:2-polyprenyl-6-hydroxyphenyl methylase/3-demethylubiquinone-9 3-methyltransferase